jgi:uncharacterized membrane protein YgaE (UPF0421/DUF939 family)
VRVPALGSRRARRIGSAARTVALNTPETLTVVRYRAQPTAATIGRLAGTAVFAYLIALAVPWSTPRPVLAPLTALLVAQVTLYQTVFSAMRRVAAVVVGVLIAVGLSAVVGFTWWSLGITIVAGLALGHLLRLRETILEVPISAMLILSVGSTEGPAAVGRILETLVGAAAGLMAGLILASPRVESAHDAMEDLCREMADLLERMAAGLCDGTAPDSAAGWLEESRRLSGEIRRVDEAVREAEESIALSPRRPRLPAERISLRDGLETLDHAAVTVRGLARSVSDLARLGAENSSMREESERSRLAGVLRDLAAAVLAYGRLATAHDDEGRAAAEADLRAHLDAAQDQQDRLSVLLASDPAQRPIGWPLRGELVSHIARLRNEIEPDGAGLYRQDRVRSWRLPRHLGWRRQLSIRSRR